VHDNEVELSGRVVGREALRHTPAGIPILTFTVKHESTQIEAGISRQVGFEVEAMAVGEVARRMDADALQAGRSVHLQGFLASRSRLSTRLVLHVNRFEFE
jgi:primosomal replication protein N